MAHAYYAVRPYPSDVRDDEGLDSSYVKQHLGQPLILGLAQICLKKPKDPIEFLAHWLYRYRETQLAEAERQADEELKALETTVREADELGAV